jgi:hypothetical protein
LATTRSNSASARRPVAAQEGAAAGEAEVGRVVAGDGQGVFREVDAEAPRGRPLGQDGEQDGAGADAEVEHPPGRVRRKVAQHVLHHGLGVGAGREHVLVDREHDLPKALAAEDLADRLAVLAAGQVVLQALGLFGAEQAVRVGDDVGAGDLGGGLDQQSGVDDGAGEAGGLQPLLGRRPGLDQGEGHGAGPSQASPVATRPPSTTWT